MLNFFKKRKRIDIIEKKIVTRVYFKKGSYDEYSRLVGDKELSDSDNNFLKWFINEKMKYYKYKFNDGIAVYDREEIRNIQFRYEEASS